MAYGTRPSLPKRGSTPDELDPVAASSTPITPDPRTRPRINSSAASADPEAIDAVRRRLIAAGIDPETAQAMAMQQVLDTKQGVLDEMDAPRREREAREAAAAAPVAPQESYASPEDIIAAGYMQKAEPGPTSMRGGGKVAQGQQFNKMSEAIGYMTRTPVTDANRAQAYPDAAYLPSQRDIDMAARGFFPVPADDGSVSYSVGTGRDPRYKQDLGRRGIPGAPGRLGPRADLEEEDPSKPGFTLEPVRGPTGTNYIYKQNEAAQQQQAAYMDERQLARFADASGLTEAELAAMTPAQQRSAVRGAKRADASDREEAWRAQMMLGGGRPTGGIGGSKATVNAWLNLPEDQRASAMRYMLPGGQLSATVDAANATQAGRMAQQAMVAFLQNNPGATPEQRAAAELQLRKGDPAAAGSTDISAGKHGTPEAIKEYERLAAANDTTTGGFSFDDERRLAGALKQPPYSLSQAEAEARAYEYAQKRRWTSGVRPGGPQPAAPGTPAPPPGSDPRAWGGGA
jgi:hypothetical protein